MYIDIFDPNGTTKIGKLFNLVTPPSIEYGTNKVYNATFVVPATDFYTYTIYSGYVFKFYFDDGSYKTFIFQTSTNNGDGKITLNCVDQMFILTQDNIGSGVSYDQTWLGMEDILTDICNRAGWTIIFDENLDDTPQSMTFEAESYFEALMTIVNFTAGYITLTGVDKQLRYGQFKNLNFTLQVPVYITYVDHLVTPDLNPNYVSIKSCTVVSDGSVIANKFIAYGGTSLPNLNFAGTIDTVSSQQMLNLGYCTGKDRLHQTTSLLPNQYVSFYGAHDWHNTVVFDETKHQWFVCNPVSIAKYGVRTRQLPVTEIVPVSNSVANLANAGNTLFDVAQFYLTQGSEPKYTYTLEVYDLPLNHIPGDICILNYTGYATNAQGDQVYINISNERLFITSFNVRYDESGGKTFSITVSNTGEEITQIDSVVSSIYSDVKNLQLRLQAAISDFCRPSPSLVLCANGTNSEGVSYAAKDFEFSWYFGADIAALNELLIDVYISPLSGNVVGTTDYDYATPITVSRPTDDTYNAISDTAEIITYDATITPPSTLNGFPVTSGTGRGDALYDWFRNQYDNGYMPLISAMYDYAGEHLHSFTRLWSGLLENSAGLMKSATHLADHLFNRHRHVVTLPMHRHSASIGVSIDNTTFLPSLSDLTITINNIPVGANISTTPDKYTFDITNLVAAGTYRESTHTIKIVCGTPGKRATCFVSVNGKITVSPLAFNSY